jgi:hypothetical protein
MRDKGELAAARALFHLVRATGILGRPALRLSLATIEVRSTFTS